MLLAREVVLKQQIARGQRVRLRIPLVLPARAPPQHPRSEQLIREPPARNIRRPGARRHPRSVGRDGLHMEQRPVVLELAEADAREEHRHPDAGVLAPHLVQQRERRLPLRRRRVVRRQRLPECEMRTMPAALAPIMVVGRERRRMEVLQVVEVDEVLDDDLPVRLDHLRRAEALQLGQLLYPMRPQMRLNPAEPLGERGRVGIRMHPDQPAPDADGGRKQADAGRVEVGKLLGPLRHADQLPLQVVGPVVIGTAQRCRLSDRSDQLRPAVAADVVKGPQLPILAHDDEDVVQPRLHGQVLARFGQILHEPRVGPGAREDPLLLAVVPLLGCVRLDGQNRHPSGHRGLHPTPYTSSYTSEWTGARRSNQGCACSSAEPKRISRASSP